MEEILHHLLYMKSYETWDIYHFFHQQNYTPHQDKKTPCQVFQKTAISIA